MYPYLQLVRPETAQPVSLATDTREDRLPVTDLGAELMSLPIGALIGALLGLFAVWLYQRAR
ncbi:MAG: hypothetical protein AAF739_03265 [Pseudomonadota bacterium]